MPSPILSNTLLSEASLRQILALPEEEGIFGSLLEIFTKFQEIKKFASEIHTEIHLVKPVLKNLGYVYESKPKFFEDHVKNPDVALFSSEEERMRDSSLWGTMEYYRNTMGIVLLKRYGRNLHEGISGFYLEFENKMPIYQMIYLLKKSKTRWGILTNGKRWLLIKRSVHFEKRLIEIDIESAVMSDDREVIHLFYRIFSCLGLKKLLPDALEAERKALIDSLTEKRIYLHKAVQYMRKKADVYPFVLDAYKQFFPKWTLPTTEQYLKENNIAPKEMRHERTGIINNYDHTDISSYMFSKKEAPFVIDLDAIMLGEKGNKFTKEDMFSLKILDITPGFGNIATQLADGLAYISFILPYKEKNMFRAEWENESTLKKYIINTMLYGIERSHIAFDILQNTMGNRYGCIAENYRLGNPLVGVSMRDIVSSLDSHNQMGLFSKNPKEIIHDFREMYTLYFSLSDKIKEDLKVKSELVIGLNTYTSRIRDIMDVATATYFTRSLENKKINDMLFNLDGSESTWDHYRNQDWFIESKQIAKKNGFFHPEIEFPMLLYNNFDCVIVQPSLNYSWEEELPIEESTKAYIKKGMTFLKPDGKLVLLSKDPIDQLMPDLKKSKRYIVESVEGISILRKRSAAHQSSISSPSTPSR